MRRRIDGEDIVYGDYERPEPTGIPGPADTRADVAMVHEAVARLGRLVRDQADRDRQANAARAAALQRILARSEPCQVRLDRWRSRGSRLCWILAGAPFGWAVSLLPLAYGVPVTVGLLALAAWMHGRLRSEVPVDRVVRRLP